MNDTAFVSGKDHTTENFPVGSRLIAARHRPAVMAYYRFARAADDISDAKAPPAERLARLDAMDAGLGAGLCGRDDPALPAVACHLGHVMAERSLDVANARDLLTAFRRDVTQARYGDWDDLLDYCRWSAMPVGRFMLDVHGEDKSLIPISDALCAALQIINHLQDCREDYAELGRVYIPGDAMAEAGLTAEALARPDPPAALVDLVRRLATRTRPLLAQSSGFGAAIKARGLACEVAVIHGLAMNLVARLEAAPFAKSRHHGKISAGFIAVHSLCTLALARNGLSGMTVRSEARR